MTTGMAGVVAVVVIGRNEGRRLRRCLRSVKAMAGWSNAQELVYVDSASMDDSIEIAAQMGARVVVLHEGPHTAARARNAGWRSVTAPFILFLDGDTVVEPDFVMAALAAFDNPAVAAVCGHRREMLSTASLYDRVLDLDWIGRAGAVEFYGGDALVRRAALDAVGGYDEKLIAGEEPELCARMRARGGVIIRLDRPMTWHELGLARWSQYWKRAIRTGHAYAEVSVRCAHLPGALWTDTASAHIRRAMAWVAVTVLCLAAAYLWRNPLLALAPILLLAAAAIRTAVRNRWKSSDWITLLLYGVQAHLQHVPIAVGQMKYWRASRHGQRSELIEYKGPVPS